MQVMYKLLFLGRLAATGQLVSVLTPEWAPFTAYLLPLLACSPWSYLLGGGRARDKAE